MARLIIIFIFQFSSIGCDKGMATIGYRQVSNCLIVRMQTSSMGADMLQEGGPFAAQKCTLVMLKAVFKDLKNGKIMVVLCASSPHQTMNIPLLATR
jgi:hypothetical protein